MFCFLIRCQGQKGQKQTWKRASHFNDYNKGVHQENHIFLKELKPETDKNNTGPKMWLLIKKECQ